MSNKTKIEYRKSLLALAIAAAMTVTAGCGGGGDGSTGSNAGTVDTSGLTVDALKTSLSAGLTKGITANTSAISQVATQSKAIQEVTGVASSIQAKAAVVTKASSESSSSSTSSDGTDLEALGAGLEFVTAVIEKSNVTQNGNVYTIDPDEASICNDPQLELDATEIQQCTDLLEDVTVVTTVNATANNQVTAATTQFQYKNASVVTTDFTSTSGYYQINLAGSKTLLTDLSAMADPEDQFPVPETMKGAVRMAFTAPSDNSGTATLSIPEQVEIKSTTPGEEIDLTLAQADKLISVSADASNLTMEMEVGFGALNLIFPDEDDVGSFPVQLAMNAMTGNVAVNSNGDVLTVTGLGLDGITMKVDSQQAMLLNMPKLDALLDASGTAAFMRLDKALDLTLRIDNIRGYFADELESTSPSAYLAASATVPAGTVLTDVSPDTVKVTAGGPVTVNMDESGDTTGSMTAALSECFKPDTLTKATCPAPQ